MFVCTVVQRIARSPQLCHSLLSNAKQEINVVCRVCVRVRLQTPLAASVSLLEECVCMREREREQEMCLPTGQRETHARKSRAVPSFSPCAVFLISKSMCLLSLAVKLISRASHAITKLQVGCSKLDQS